jgi:hypothetical protein
VHPKVEALFSKRKTVGGGCWLSATELSVDPQRMADEYSGEVQPIKVFENTYRIEPSDAQR